MSVSSSTSRKSEAEPSAPNSGPKSPIAPSELSQCPFEDRTCRGGLPYPNKKVNQRPSPDPHKCLGIDLSWALSSALLFQQILFWARRYDVASRQIASAASPQMVRSEKLQNKRPRCFVSHQVLRIFSEVFEDFPCFVFWEVETTENSLPCFTKSAGRSTGKIRRISPKSKQGNKSRHYPVKALHALLTKDQEGAL